MFKDDKVFSYISEVKCNLRSTGKIGVVTGEGRRRGDREHVQVGRHWD